MAGPLAVLRRVVGERRRAPTAARGCMTSRLAGIDNLSAEYCSPAVIRTTSAKKISIIGSHHQATAL
jgi:hypothetical protein